VWCSVDCHHTVGGEGAIILVGCCFHQSSDAGWLCLLCSDQLNSMYMLCTDAGIVLGWSRRLHHNSFRTFMVSCDSHMYLVFGTDGQCYLADAILPAGCVALLAGAMLVTMTCC
jgi:hypothetical protein